MSKTPSPKTAQLVDRLRESREAITLIYGGGPLIASLNAAISRLSLLDAGLQVLANDNDAGQRSPQNVKDVARMFLER